MAPRKTTKAVENVEETQVQEEAKVEETSEVVAEPVVEEVPVAEEAPAEEPQADPAPEAVEKPIEEEEVYTGNADAPSTPVSSGDLYSSRAVVDTSGTAGPADHDIRRGTAAFDKLAEDRNEVPTHLRKYVDSDEGYHKIVEREAARREDA